MTKVRCRVRLCDYNLDGLCKKREIQIWNYGVATCHTQFPKKQDDIKEKQDVIK